MVWIAGKCYERKQFFQNKTIIPHDHITSRDKKGRGKHLVGSSFCKFNPDPRVKQESLLVPSSLQTLLSHLSSETYFFHCWKVTTESAFFVHKFPISLLVAESLS